MRTYRPRAGGGFEATLDNGMTVAVPQSEEQLQSMGYAPEMQSDPADPVTAGNFRVATPEETAPRAHSPTPGLADVMRAQGITPGASPLLADPPPPSEAQPQERPALYNPLDESQGQPAAAPQSRARFIPGKMQLTSRSSVRGPQYTPEATARVDEALANVVEARREAAENTRARLANESIDLQLEGLKKEDALKADQAKRAEVNQRIEAKMAEARRLNQEAAEMKVDPTAGLPKSFAGRLAMAIAYGLAGGIKARTGRDIGVAGQFESINKAAIEAQKLEIQQARQAGRDADNELSRLTDLYGTPEAAEKAFEIRQNELIKERMRAKAVAVGSEEAMQNFSLWEAEFEADNAQRDAELTAILQTTENEQYQPGRVIGGAPQKLEAMDRAVILPDGSTTWARTKEKARDAQDLINSSAAIRDKVERLRELTTSATGRAWGTEDKARAKSLGAALQMDLKKAYQLGALDKGAIEVTDRMMGNPEAFFRNPGADAALDELGRGATHIGRRIVETELHGDPGATRPAMRGGPASMRRVE